MPPDDDGAEPDVEQLRQEAARFVQLSREVLDRTDIGEMDRQIECCRLREKAMGYLEEVAILTKDAALLKYAGEQASKWAGHMRSATTKRRNDEVPRLIAMLADRREFARQLLGIEEDE